MVLKLIFLNLNNILIHLVLNYYQIFLNIFYYMTDYILLSFVKLILSFFFNYLNYFYTFFLVSLYHFLILFFYSLFLINLFLLLILFSFSLFSICFFNSLMIIVDLIEVEFFYIIFSNFNFNF